MTGGGPTASRAPFSGAARLAEDTRRRFLAAIVERVPIDRVAEVHLFTPIRQGGAETGVAVIAARPETAEPETAAPETAELDAAGDLTEDAASATTSDDAVPVDAPSSRPLRHTVFTARYRLTIKGPDRGKWDADVVEEADAPLVTVEAVVRGVQRRAGDAAEPDRLSGEHVARIVGVPNAAPNGVPNGA